MLFIWKNKIRRLLEGDICPEALLLLELFAFKATPRSTLHLRRADLVPPGLCVCWLLSGFAQKEVLVTDYRVKERTPEFSHFLHSSSSH